MNRIEKLFSHLTSRGEKALIAYLCAGDPSIDFTFEAVKVLEKNGVDMVELGIPFSDPLADGPIIQEASNRALRGGVKMKDLFHLVERIRRDSSVPLLMMGYYNSLYQYGVEDFVLQSKEVGLDGLIIPDLPPEEGERLKEASQGQGLSLVFLLAPTSTPDRIKKVAAVSSGFIYCVSVTGVTGVREGSFHRLKGLISQIKSLTPLPLAAGFGISTAAQARELSSMTHGIIVGSAFIRIIQENLTAIQGGDRREALDTLGDFAQELKGALLEVF